MWIKIMVVIIFHFIESSFLRIGNSDVEGFSTKLMNQSSCSASFFSVRVSDKAKPSVVGWYIHISDISIFLKMRFKVLHKALSGREKWKMTNKQFSRMISLQCKWILCKARKYNYTFLDLLISQGLPPMTCLGWLRTSCWILELLKRTKPKPLDCPILSFFT